MRAQEAVLRVALLVDHRKHDCGKTSSRGVEITVSCKMNITVLAQLSTRRERAICTKVNCLEVCSRRCNRENLFSLLPREWQPPNRKLSTGAAGPVFNDSRVVRSARRRHILYL